MNLWITASTQFLLVPIQKPFPIFTLNLQGKDIFGIGVSHNIGYASMKGIICAINRDQKDTMRDDTMPGIFDEC